jgi:hypothetical protein
VKEELQSIVLESDKQEEQQSILQLDKPKIINEQIEQLQHFCMILNRIFLKQTFVVSFTKIEYKLIFNTLMFYSLNIKDFKKSLKIPKG